MSDGKKYPSVFNLLGDVFRKSGVQAVLVGGYAVNAYHYSRFTHDVDFMIAAEDLPGITTVLLTAGFTETLRNELVVRYTDATDDQTIVDFLLADRSTLNKIIASGGSVSIAGESFLLPSIRHLVAMKLHSIRSNRNVRELIDLPDIIIMLRKNGIDPREQSFREMCLQFGDQELYDKILKGCL